MVICSESNRAVIKKLVKCANEHFVLVDVVIKGLIIWESNCHEVNSLACCNVRSSYFKDMILIFFSNVLTNVSLLVSIVSEGLIMC